MTYKLLRLVYIWQHILFGMVKTVIVIARLPHFKESHINMGLLSIQSAFFNKFLKAIFYN